MPPKNRKQKRKRSRQTNATATSSNTAFQTNTTSSNNTVSSSSSSSNTSLPATNTSTVTMQNIDSTLQSIVDGSELPSTFTFDDFQKGAYQRLAEGYDLLVALRTGGGKFLIGALAILFCGLGVVFVAIPLDMLALEHQSTLVNTLNMDKDDVKILKSENFDEVLKRVINTTKEDAPLFVLGRPDILLQLVRSRKMKASKSVSLLVVDEAMLIEEWGSSGFIVEWKQMRAILDQNKYIRFVGLSGSSSNEQLYRICKIMNINAEQSIYRGDMSRPDLSLTIIEDIPSLRHRNKDWEKGSATSFVFTKILALLANEEDDRGCIVWCNSKDECDRLCSRLNTILKEKGLEDKHAAYTYYNNNSMDSMRAVLGLYKDPTHPCDILICSLAIFYGLNLPPTQAVFAMGCPNNVSSMWQLLSRANRTRDELLFGACFMLVSLKKYRRDVNRKNQKLMSSTSRVEDAAREVADVRKIYRLGLDLRLCLRLKLETNFGGAQMKKCCERGDIGACGNCLKKWNARDIRLAAINEWNAADSKKAKTAALKKVKKTIGRVGDTIENENKNSGSFPKARVVCVPGSNVTWRVLPSNKDISLFVEQQTKYFLRLQIHRFGLTMKALVKKIAAASGSGTSGLKPKEVEWCLWWFMTCGYLDEVENVGVGTARLGVVVERRGRSRIDSDDGNNSGSDEEHKEDEQKRTKQIWHVQMVPAVNTNAAWDDAPLNERLGNYDIDEDFEIQVAAVEE